MSHIPYHFRDSREFEEWMMKKQGLAESVKAVRNEANRSGLPSGPKGVGGPMDAYRHILFAASHSGTVQMGVI